MFALLLVLALANPAIAGGSDENLISITVSPEILTRYDTIRLALLDDKLDAALGAARELASTNAADAPLKSAADALAAAPDLPAARIAFGGLSRVLVLRVGSMSPTPKVLVYHCPMFSGYGWWLQPTAGIGNPYMGQAMPKCGEEKSLRAAVKAASASL